MRWTQRTLDAADELDEGFQWQLLDSEGIARLRVLQSAKDGRSKHAADETGEKFDMAGGTPRPHGLYVNASVGIGDFRHGTGGRVARDLLVAGGE